MEPVNNQDHVRPAGPGNETGPQLGSLLERLASYKGVQHAVLAVSSGDGSLDWADARGSAQPDGTPMTVDTPYGIASIDKLFTASIIFRLHERGALELDEPISSYLPQRLAAGLHRLNDQDRSGEVTVGNLLGHTSGLANYLEDRPRHGKRLIQSLTTGADHSWDTDEAIRIVREELTPHFPPQPREARHQRIRYSDTNYVLLQAIIENLTGQQLHEVFDQLIFTPLALNQTWVAGHLRPQLTVREPAALWAGNNHLKSPLALRSLRAIYSSAPDQIRFMKALAYGELFDKPDTAGLMGERWNRFGFPVDAATLRAPGWPIEYGLGIMRFELPRLLTGFRRLPALFGHSGSTGTWLFHSPELDVIIAGTVDQVAAGALPYRFLPKILRVLTGS